ncbi:hypothetical protein [Pseudomonas sp. JS425]|uniref:hypothetical protein n=1 Tax=Pseudomonas sp. JS425 TaxID=2829498 RepID=UPI001BB007CE|nr:hypothetical protein [Pseudomonas sp. JS425]QUN66340.1 hypothetical protein KDB76_21020 [Pseudomonas sp. JS425]
MSEWRGIRSQWPGIRWSKYQRGAFAAEAADEHRFASFLLGIAQDRVAVIIARDPSAIAVILCIGLAFGGMFAFITASPYV